MTKIDMKGRILIPKEMRDRLGIKENNQFIVSIRDPRTIELKLIETPEEDPLSWVIRHPIKGDPSKVQRWNIEETKHEWF